LPNLDIEGEGLERGVPAPAPEPAPEQAEPEPEEPRPASPALDEKR
jgi:hypothetical protein